MATQNRFLSSFFKFYYTSLRIICKVAFNDFGVLCSEICKAAYFITTPQRAFGQPSDCPNAL